MIFSPKITALLDVCYFAWFGVVSLVFVHQFFSRNRLLSQQYLVSSALSWMCLGHIVACLFSSVGPCFYYLHHTLPESYHTMFMYLLRHHQLINAVMVQSAISPDHAQRFTNLVSAFPSMHVACATLVACYASHYSRVLKYLAIFFCLNVMVASVHLGWHYLSDVLVGAMAALGIWRFVGIMLKKFHQAPVVLVP